MSTKISIYLSFLSFCEKKIEKVSSVVYFCKTNCWIEICYLSYRQWRKSWCNGGYRLPSCFTWGPDNMSFIPPPLVLDQNFRKCCGVLHVYGLL